MQLLNKDLEGLRRLEGLPACAGICSIRWLSQDTLLVCTTTSILFCDFGEKASGLTVLEGTGKQRFVSAACSPGNQTLAAGCVDKMVRTTYSSPP